MILLTMETTDTAIKEVSKINTTSVWDFVVILFIFILILVIAYFTSKFVAGNQKVFYKNKNIHPIETYRVTNNKFIQILYIGGKYIAVGIGKEEMTFLSELDESQLLLQEDEEQKNAGRSFKDIMDKFKIPIKKVEHDDDHEQ